MPIKRETPLSELKLLNKEEINKIAGERILSVFPYYKQLNLARTSSAEFMYGWIDNIRNLSNTANIAIDSSISSDAIYDIVQTFKRDIL